MKSELYSQKNISTLNIHFPIRHIFQENLNSPRILPNRNKQCPYQQNQCHNQTTEFTCLGIMSKLKIDQIHMLNDCIKNLISNSPFRCISDTIHNNVDNCWPSFDVHGAVLRSICCIRTGSNLQEILSSLPGTRIWNDNCVSNSDAVLQLNYRMDDLLYVCIVWVRASLAYLRN